MKILADLHLHSKYSRATSPQMTPKSLSDAAKVKGLNLLGTGDFTHPKYLEELKQILKPTGNGFFEYNKTYFVLQTEISNMYTQDGKGRRVHNIIYAPDFETVDQINSELDKWGRRDYDGRPIFGKSCIELAEMLFSVSKDIMLVPAHLWTPWFGAMGDKSYFNSLDECYGEYTSKIHAVETGLSSDPEMNWRWSKLDKFTLISNSDAHSAWPWRLGRECNIFDIEPTYQNLKNAIETRKNFLETIEVDPSYGKYHFDGHRNCNTSFTPEESKKHSNICPVCKKPLIIGVMNRVEQFADRPEGFKPKDAVDFKKLIPLHEILSAFLRKGVATKTVWREFYKLTDGDSELSVLLEKSQKDLEKKTSLGIADAIIKSRNGEIKIKPGYDGVYGVPIFESLPEHDVKQKALGEF